MDNPAYLSDRSDCCNYTVSSTRGGWYICDKCVKQCSIQVAGQVYVFNPVHKPKYKVGDLVIVPHPAHAYSQESVRWSFYNGLIESWMYEVSIIDGPSSFKIFEESEIIYKL